MRRTILACVITALAVGGGGTAVAAKLITSKDIADGTIRGRDVHKGTITLNRLSPGVQHLLAKAGTPGANGANGVNGVNGKDGAPGATGAQGGNSGLPSGFSVTNKSVGLTTSGVDFGPYADGGPAGGSLYYNGLNGHKLSELASLYYQAKYATSDGNDVAAPYLRVFVKDQTADVVFSPNTQPTKATSEDAFHKWVVTDGTVRYSDDTGDGPDSPWATVKAAHGNEVISGIYVTAGFSAGQNLEAVLNGMGVNGQTFNFAG